MRLPGRRHSALPGSRQGVEGGEQVARALLPLAHLWAQFLLQTRLLMLSPGDNDGQPLPGAPSMELCTTDLARKWGEELTDAVPTLPVLGGSVVLLAGTLRDPRSSRRDQHVLQGGCRGGRVGGAVTRNQRPLLLPSATGQLAYRGWLGTSRGAEAVWTAARA